MSSERASDPGPASRARGSATSPSGDGGHGGPDSAGWRIAVAGKGGSGKTTISGTLARILADRGHAVVGVDADPNPNLGLTLGLGPEQLDAGVPLSHDVLAHEKRGDESVLVLGQPFEEVLRDHALEAPAGIRLLTMGRPTAAGGG